ncbi:MAG: hypothetical protein LBQ52_10790 [Helicobacteraceae bacterium]|jgi:hypothetical protein|nr:hypothetical protein [Helicobacteraceae bacterium]
MNVKAIVEDWLLERGYSGLSCEKRGNTCACEIDNLMPCDCSKKQKAFGSLVIDIGELNEVMMEANERSKSDRANAIPKSEIVELKGVS